MESCSSSFSVKLPLRVFQRRQDPGDGLPRQERFRWRDGHQEQLCTLTRRVLPTGGRHRAAKKPPFSWGLAKSGSRLDVALKGRHSTHPAWGRRGLLAEAQAIWMHGLDAVRTNQDSQKVGVDNKRISKWNILETHTAKHSIGFFEKHTKKTTTI